jgi:hypothetical protein
VFAILLASYAFFWHSRDWNSASRLMLAYALCDRATLAIDGLYQQTNDRAFFRGRHYSDKQPGYSFLAAPIYCFMKIFLRQPAHPLDVPAMRHWPADFWVTLGTSGVLSALCGALLAAIVGQIGCGPRRAALVGLSYGLGTPAYVYATLAYGHQTAATLLLGAFAMVATGWHKWPRGRAFLAGFLVSYAATVDLAVAPICVVVSFIALARVMRRDWPAMSLGFFALGALGPALFLISYNTIAFGSPLDVGYAHHVVPRFREIHGRGNPLGLGAPRWHLVVPLLFSEYRGLLIYAPVVALAPLGWCVLGARRMWALGFGSIASCLALFLVNLSYPEWTGGWCTGPRLLVPMLPFAMIAVGAALGIANRRAMRALTLLACILALAGGLVILGCQGVDARIPDTLYDQPLTDPLRSVVLPHWRGDPVPAWWEGGRFGKNLASIFWPRYNDDSIVPPHCQWIQFAPLLAFQGLAISLLMWGLRPNSQGK